MVDQLEFADIILINKIDLMRNKADLDKVKKVIRNLNPGAEIIETHRSVVPLKKIINTNKFNFEKASQFDDWLEKDRFDIQPETEEYNISSFVYSADRPFHPVKINQLSTKLFMTSI